MAIAEIRQSTRGNAVEKMKGINFGDLIVPGLFVLIFSLLTMFVYIPSIQDTLDKKDEIDEVNTEQDKLRANIKVVEELSSDRGGLYNDLQKTQKIIPKNMDVADFAYFVDKLAKDSGLKFNEITQQDCVTADSTGQRYEKASTVCGPISYNGNYDQIVDFLDKLQDESPYIVEVLVLEISAKSRIDDDENPIPEEDVEWGLDIDIVGLYLPEDEQVTKNSIYIPIVPYTRHPELLEIFEYKAKILDENPDSLDAPPEETPEDAIVEEEE